MIADTTFISDLLRERCRGSLGQRAGFFQARDGREFSFCFRGVAVGFSAFSRTAIRNESILPSHAGNNLEIE